MAPLVELAEVSKVYNSGRRFAALDGVSITIASGEAVAIMGPSGSGKSTLLNLIGGLDRPSSGEVLVDGSNVGKLGEARLARFRRQKVGIIFQFFNLVNNLTALDNVLIPAQLAGENGRAAQRRACDLLERLQIGQLRNQYPAKLSGGERQRVAIARALINNPPLVLADEPTGALDSAHGAEVMEIFAELHKGGQTLVLVTHDEHLARANATRVIHLIDGAVVPGETSRMVQLQ
jgi:putative ABC transport system ATP-binding protein